jgi:CRISPR-associated protein Cmr1
MPRADDIPACPAVPASRASNRIVKDYRISLITPMFGGGVEAGVPDASLPIRGTAIRGQLAFWWRATRGASYATYEELFARHGEIWGATSKASQVEVTVTVHEVAAPVPCASYVRQGDGNWRLTWNPLLAGSPSAGPLPYALFPFQGEQPEAGATAPKKLPAQYVSAASFTLRLRYPKALASDVETAVWAWVSFGGLGARTRRGCGALQCKELTPKSAGEIASWLRGRVHPASELRAWPTLPDRLLAGTPGTPAEAWRQGISLLQRFRQEPGFARNPVQNGRPGRSRYPEPETIRRTTGTRSPGHHRMPQIPNDAFPRAELGLPIVFHFKGADEPPDTVLYPRDDQGKTRDRMASPLIVKPLALADGKAVPIVVRLQAPALPGVDLKQGRRSIALPDTTETRGARLGAYPNSPLHASPSGSALDAFLHFVRAKGFREVLR